MNNASRPVPHSPGRRALLVGAAAAPLWAGRAFAQADPEVAAYKAFVGARAVRTERLVLDIPRIADNGNLVPVRIALPGPFAPGAEVKSIHLFSQKNPVPQMAVFHFPVPVGRVEVESRVRLAGTQRVAAVATLADGTLYAATADVIVTVSACIDGT
jgi:sulfur-oxidizing protein SoxY